MLVRILDDFRREGLAVEDVYGRWNG